MSMKYIRDYYRVPAKRGGRVRFVSVGTDRVGTIVGARGQYLRVRFDDGTMIVSLHPTSGVTYIAAESTS